MTIKTKFYDTVQLKFINKSDQKCNLFSENDLRQMSGLRHVTQTSFLRHSAA